MLCKIRIEKIEKEIFLLSRTFFFRKISSTNTISFYSNTERKGQHTGWVEEVVILGSIHDPQPRDIG